MCRGSEFRSWYEYTGSVSPSQPGWMDPPRLIPNTSWIPQWVVEHRTNEKYTPIIASSFKKPKRYLSDSETESDFPRFIIIKSLHVTKLDQLSHFLIEKIISSWSNPKTVKKLRTGNLLVEVESKKHAENLLEMEKFHNLKYRAYPHTKLNTSKGVVRSKELSLATPEEIEMAFKKQGIKEYRRVTIRRNDETILTHTYILTFEKLSVPKEI